jgi:hypothetical protein
MRRPAKTTHHKQALAPPRSRARAAAAWVGALFLLSVSSASAGTDIQGTPDDLQLKVENASIVEILNALSARFQVMFKARSHNPRVLTGAYSGTLRETLTRVLDGNDYILERSDKGIEITILGASADGQPTRPAVTASATPPPGPALASAPKPPPAVPTSASVPNINPSISSASVPPLSSFAVVPPLTP